MTANSETTIEGHLRLMHHFNIHVVFWVGLCLFGSYLLCDVVGVFHSFLIPVNLICFQSQIMAAKVPVLSTGIMQFMRSHRFVVTVKLVLSFVSSSYLQTLNTNGTLINHLQQASVHVLSVTSTVKLVT